MGNIYSTNHEEIKFPIIKSWNDLIINYRDIVNKAQQYPDHDFIYHTSHNKDIKHNADNDKFYVAGSTPLYNFIKFF